MNLFICYAKCRTCQKARKYLEEHNILFEERDIKVNNPTYEELKKWYDLGVPINKMVNTSGLVYKKLNLKEKRSRMSDEELLRLLSADGMLVKRPILLTEKNVLFGFNEKEYEESL